MNHNGGPIKACADFYGLKAEDILIVHDDLDLPVGRIRIIKKGGAAGHKGVLSVIHHLGTDDFPRIKIGIGRPRYVEAIEEYVLSPFYRDEEGIMEKVIQMAVQACGLFVLNGVEAAMNQMNCRNLTDKEVFD
jgi:PTH1 family peptidyl-tRNA hydrolase